MTGQSNGLRIVDGRELPEHIRQLLKPGEWMRGRTGGAHRLPRFFYAVESSDIAVNTRLTPHFGLWEFMEVDLYEAAALRRYPRYVPCAVTAMAAALEVLRAEVGLPIRVAANGGYRSPSHAGSRSASPHCWGTAANIFKIGNESIDTEEKIQRFGALAEQTLSGCWARPFGSEYGQTDDHLHLDIGYVTVVPRLLSEEVGH